MQTYAPATLIKRTVLERSPPQGERYAGQGAPTRRLLGEECRTASKGGVSNEVAAMVVRAFDAYEKAEGIHDRLLESEETDPFRLLNSADVVRDRLTELREAINSLRVAAQTNS